MTDPSAEPGAEPGALADLVQPPTLIKEYVNPRSATIRRQLIWASFFPLAFFGLLSILVTSTALREMALNLALKRNTALVQAAAANLATRFDTINPLNNTSLAAELSQLGLDAGSQLYIVEPGGKIIAATKPGLTYNPFLGDERVTQFVRDGKPHSLLEDSGASGDPVILSLAPLPEQGNELILEELQETVLKPISYYQMILVGLLVLGTSLSLGMLSVALGRMVQPINDLVDYAIQTVPGSIFHPMPERGPTELRALIQAFNQMVIRLAEQQTALREYSNRALFSQEEERQRLSHELHDGTVQDLVGLVQRVELCQREMEHDPAMASRRLSELKGLVERCLNEVRRISNALRPSILEDLGLPAALQALCNDLEGQVPGLRCNCSITGEPRRLPEDLELAIFRVAQEAIGNTRKHAQNVTLVNVSLAFAEAGIQVRIQNDGTAFEVPDVRTHARTGHLGLTGMYERARFFGGEIRVTSSQEEGTDVLLRLPYPQDLVN